MAVPGDVHLDNENNYWIVVDVEGHDKKAVLRAPDDFDLLNPKVLSLEQLVIVDHVRDVPGWTEVQHGTWERQT